LIKQYYFKELGLGSVGVSLAFPSPRLVWRPSGLIFYFMLRHVKAGCKKKKSSLRNYDHRVENAGINIILIIVPPIQHISS